jgi:hypothetical protein
MVINMMMCCGDVLDGRMHEWIREEEAKTTPAIAKGDAQPWMGWQDGRNETVSRLGNSEMKREAMMTPTPTCGDRLFERRVAF